MSIAVQIVCDGCGKAVDCGSGKERKHAHQIRTKLRDCGWLVDWTHDGDLCAECRPVSRRAEKQPAALNAAAKGAALFVRPWTVRKSDALAFVRVTHRRLPDIQGAMWCVTVRNGNPGRDGVVGVALVGHPSQAQTNDEYEHLRVTRVAVAEGHQNACSMLYAACWRAARAMGALRMDTFTHSDERGASLRAAGWIPGGMTAGGEHSRKARPRKAQVDPRPKQRWWAPGSVGVEIIPV